MTGCVRAKWFLYCFFLLLPRRKSEVDISPPLSSVSLPLLSYPPHSLRPLLLVLLLLGALLGRVLLHALRDGLVVFGDVVEEPLQALLDGLVHLFSVAEDGRARLLCREIRCYDVMTTGSGLALCLYLVKRP